MGRYKENKEEHCHQRLYIPERYRGKYLKKYDAYQIKGKTRELSFSIYDENRDPFQQLTLYNRCGCGYLYKKKYKYVRDIVCVRCYFQIPKTIREKYAHILLGWKDQRDGSQKYSDPSWIEAVMDILNELITVIPISDRRKATLQNNYMLLLESQILWEKKRKEKIMIEYLKMGEDHTPEEIEQILIDTGVKVGN